MNMNDNEHLPFSGNTQIKYPVLMSADEIRKSYHALSEKAESAVAGYTDGEEALISLLEKLRGESDWHHIRAYLSAVDAFPDLKNQHEKSILLDYLGRMLSHPNGTIRRIAAQTAGRLIAACDDVSYVMAWKGFLHRGLFPGHTLTEQQRRWTGFALRFTLRELLTGSAPERKRGVLHIYAEYFKSSGWDPLTCLFLIDAISGLPVSEWTILQQNMIYNFTRHFLTGHGRELRVASLRLLDGWLESGWNPSEQILLDMHRAGTSPADHTAEQYLAARIHKKTTAMIGSNPSLAALTGAEQNITFDLHSSDISELTLENQRSETPWLIKLVNISILRDLAADDRSHEAEYAYASHLIAMLRFSETVTVRRQAGSLLAAAIPFLCEEDRMAVMQELCRAVETGDDAVTADVPSCIGKIIFQLDEKDRTETVSILRSLMDRESVSLSQTVLETFVFILRNMPENDDPEPFLEPLRLGLASYHHHIAEEALFLIGSGLFGSPEVSDRVKSLVYSGLGRRMLDCIYSITFDDSIFYSAASLCAIDAFLLSGYSATDLDRTDDNRPVAFFPGTFDPFSAGHLAVAREVTGMGFRVFVVLDESFQNKHPQPLKIRARIIEMSIAALPNCYLYPHPVSLRLRLPEDLNALSEAFKGHALYIIQGDKKSGHITLSPLSGNEKDTRTLRLPAKYRDMSSSNVRAAISRGSDIRGLVEDQVRFYIKEKKLYSGDVLYSRTAGFLPAETDLDPFEMPEDPFTTALPPETPQVLSLTLAGDDSGQFQHDAAVPKKSHRARTADNRGTGRVLFHVEPSENEKWDDILPESFSGDMMVIDSVEGEDHDDSRSVLAALTEALVFCQDFYGCKYALTQNPDQKTAEYLALFGFLPLSSPAVWPGEPARESANEYGQKETDSHETWWAVDFTHTTVLLSDTAAFIRDPFRDEENLRSLLARCNLKLRAAAARLYPGYLLLNFDSDILNCRIAGIAADTAQEIQENDGEESIAVPFGKIMKNASVPGAVTRELNTEKVYTADLAHFTIREFPGYDDLSSQIRTIRSFHRRIVLIDDLYHKGYRMEKIRRILREEKIDSEKLVVGILSGKGAAFAEKTGTDVDCAYYVPDMKVWLLESDLYPFIGGDGIETGTEKKGYRPALPSVNTILPYQTPSFMSDADTEAFADFSETALENARSVFLNLEEQYQKKYHRLLTPARLGEVMAEPRYPADALPYGVSPDLQISDILLSELKRLKRLRHK